MSNGRPLFALPALQDVQQSTQLLTQLLGVKSIRGLTFSPTIVPGMDAVDMLLQPISETLTAETDINAAGGIAAGSAYTLFTVPSSETWRFLDGAISSDALDADQACAFTSIYTDGPIVAGIPDGVLRTGTILSIAASQLEAADFLFGAIGSGIWFRPGARVGFVLNTAAVVGVALNIRINGRIRIARLRV